jgi:dolichol-phosphate mannosyltransferase
MSLERFSVVVPAFNEAPGIASVLTRLSAHLASLRPQYEIETIVVDDGSTDGTADIVAEHCTANDPSVRLIRHDRNAGLIAAMRTGASSSGFETVVFLDADLSYRPEIVEPLVRARLDAHAKAALASPYMPGGYVANVPPVRLIASRAANAVLRLVARSRLHTFTGMVRAYDREAFLQLATRDVVGEFNTWAVGALLADGHEVVEIPAALVWPAERSSAASRYHFKELVRRFFLVVVTSRMLAGAVRMAETKARARTFALSRSTSGP